MKKTLTILLMAMLVVGLMPFAFGESETVPVDDSSAYSGDSGGYVNKDRAPVVISANNNKVVKKIVRDEKEDVRDALQIDRERCLKSCGQQNKTSCEAKCRALDKAENVRDIRKGTGPGMIAPGKFKVKNAADLEARNISSAKIAEFRSKFEESKAKFEDAKSIMEGDRQKLKEAIQKKDKNASLDNARQYLVHTSEVIISHLEKLKSKVQENANIDADTAASIVSQIDAQIAEINAIKASAESATTREQVKDAAKQLAEKWKKLKVFVQLHTSRIVAARVQGIVNQGLVLEKRLDKVLEQAASKGITIDVQSEVNDFKSKLNASRDSFQQAQEKIRQALALKIGNETSSSEQAKSLMEEANKLLTQSRDSLKEANSILKEIIKKIRESFPSADLSKETEVEV